MASLQDHIETIERYYRGGCEPGSCTKAVLENARMLRVLYDNGYEANVRRLVNMLIAAAKKHGAIVPAGLEKL